MKGFGGNFFGVRKSAARVFLNHLISLIYRLKLHAIYNAFYVFVNDFCAEEQMTFLGYVPGPLDFI